jgi:small subunit ribosomal protein S6
VGRGSLSWKGMGMALYEHIFLARQDVSQQQVEALTEQIKAKIASLGGAVTKVEPWGVKSLAYRIKKNRKAHFTLLNIAAPSEAVVEVERLLSINEDVLRYLTIRVDEHETGPSAMLRKRDDSEREDRGSRGSRGDRPERGERSDRAERGERPERADRPPRRAREDANYGVN